jgi:hypothetical protein
LCVDIVIDCLLSPERITNLTVSNASRSGNTLFDLFFHFNN